MFRGLFKRVVRLLTGSDRLDEELYEELEQALLEADVGVRTATRLVEGLRAAARRGEVSSPPDAEGWLRREVARILAGDGGLRWHPEPPSLVLVVGVNGTGKTTTIAKLARRLADQGKRVLLAAGDTFRAAAIDQLEAWAERLGMDLVRHQEGSDAAAVVFDAVQAGRARGVDVVIADTAGRLHTKSNLMEELRKVHRTAQRALGRPPDEVLLVLDATIGQNAVAQAKSFTEVVPISGIVLTKMDGTARGGVIVTVRDELGIPIKLVGTGEKPADLDEFRPAEFADALFDGADDRGKGAR